MKKLLLLLFSILISSQSFGHRYWKYENNFSTNNYHPKVSRIYMITENGSYVDFSGASFTSDNCSNIGTVPITGATYTVDLGSTNKVQGYGFYSTDQLIPRTTIVSLYYSDDNYTWTQLEDQQIITDRGCGEYNRNVDFNRKIVCVGTTTQVINNLVYLPSITVKPFTGISSCKYENGQIQSKGNVKDAKKVGKWTYGKKVGKWTTWYKNGQMESEKHYKEGKEAGKWTFWYENGQKKKELNYKNAQ